MNANSIKFLVLIFVHCNMYKDLSHKTELKAANFLPGWY